jgi:flagellar motor switch/type III secretory pathway protein FliN
MSESDNAIPHSSPEYPWEFVHDLPCDISVEVPVPGFRARDLLRLRRRAIIDSHWSKGTDVPLRVNGELIGWAEFEVVGDRLAARLTELA